MKYVLNFCRSTQPGFRAAEMNGLSKLFDFDLSSKESLFDESKPHAVVEFENVSTVKQLLSRSILLKSATELYAFGENYDDFYQSVKNNRGTIEKQVNENAATFSIWVDSTGKKLNQKYKVAKIEELSFLSLKGTVNLDKPDVCYYLLEYYGTDPLNVPDSPLELYFGRLIGKGQRAVPGCYDLKTRKCIGNTSMDPLLAFIATNVASVSKNSLILDPFVGTGSLLLPAAHFGAYCIGCDINYNLIHGAGKSSRHDVKYRCRDDIIRSNFEQYGLKDYYLDIMIADASRSELWRDCAIALFDAIITDPPYGIREKSLKVGAQVNQYPDVEPLSDSHPVRYPSKIKYSFLQVFLDLLNFSSKHLTLNGRLVYWFPIVYKDYDEAIIPRHPCLNLVTKSEQKLSSSHGRLLICMEKIKEPQPNEMSFVLKNNFETSTPRDFIFPNGLLEVTT